MKNSFTAMLATMQTTLTENVSRIFGIDQGAVKTTIGVDEVKVVLTLGNGNVRNTYTFTYAHEELQVSINGYELIVENENVCGFKAPTITISMSVMKAMEGTIRDVIENEKNEKNEANEANEGSKENEVSEE